MQQPKAGMTVDEFLAWAEEYPGRYELLDGIVYGMSPERAGHARAKSRVHRALDGAITGLASPARRWPTA